MASSKRLQMLPQQDIEHGAHESPGTRTSPWCLSNVASTHLCNVPALAINAATDLNSPRNPSGNLQRAERVQHGVGHACERTSVDVRPNLRQAADHVPSEGERPPTTTKLLPEEVE
eukprot:CAMPEP_0178449844 /NCGR_PEP_ID=MMETSP0689_2-20121128/42789_1 /TAXON_ID=160604 /ORGANISM="Amphidinium massartii, Strain CS-259" /LENGTH=115 /DNA_ID=CAMNT_0020075233 /DNA_START=115 /DNA_END=464 /DNA_ORIENTATION=+